MSDLLTVCTVKGESGGYGFAHWGRKTRAEATTNAALHAITE